MKLADDPELCTLASEKGWLPITFLLDSLVRYLTTQSNIEDAVRKGKDLNAIVSELREDLSCIDLTGTFQYAYSYEILQYAGR